MQLKLPLDGAMTTCANPTCKLKGTPIPQDLALEKKCYNASAELQTEHFCGTACHEEWYVNSLRTLGM